MNNTRQVINISRNPRNPILLYCFLPVRGHSCIYTLPTHQLLGCCVFPLPVGSPVAGVTSFLCNRATEVADVITNIWTPLFMTWDKCKFWKRASSPWIKTSSPCTASFLSPEQGFNGPMAVLGLLKGILISIYSDLTIFHTVQLVCRDNGLKKHHYILNEN